MTRPLYIKPDDLNSLASHKNLSESTAGPQTASNVSKEIEKKVHICQWQESSGSWSSPGSITVSALSDTKPSPKVKPGTNIYRGVLTVLLALLSKTEIVKSHFFFFTFNYTDAVSQKYNLLIFHQTDWKFIQALIVPDASSCLLLPPPVSSCLLLPPDPLQTEWAIEFGYMCKTGIYYWWQRTHFDLIEAFKF